MCFLCMSIIRQILLEKEKKEVFKINIFKSRHNNNMLDSNRLHVPQLAVILWRCCESRATNCVFLWLKALQQNFSKPEQIRGSCSSARYAALFYSSLSSSSSLSVLFFIILCDAPQIDAVCSAYLSADLKFWVSELWFCLYVKTCIWQLYGVFIFFFFFFNYQQLFFLVIFFPGIWCLRRTLCLDAGPEVKGTSCSLIPQCVCFSTLGVM